MRATSEPEARRLQAIQPVERIPTDSDLDQPSEGIALCLSGGGYRAMLFHLGALWRLNDAGYLRRLDRVSSVSGGSIAAGVLALAWPRLAFDQGGVARGFLTEVVAPVRRLADRTIDLVAILRGLLGPGSAAEHLAAAYRRHLFLNSTLQNLPGDGAPRFVLNAANLQSGALWRFSRPYARDYRVGEIQRPTISLATAVAASSAFPPFLSPLVLRFPESAYTPGSGSDLQKPPYTTRVVLTDGGVYDNLGLETAWKNYTTILVSDGGGKAGPLAMPPTNWLMQTRRVLDVIDNQVRSLRKRQVIASYELPAGSPGWRSGAYWGIRSDISHYGLADSLPCPVELTTKLADVPTRLARLAPDLQEALVNWGFGVCDAALRKHVDPALPRPTDFPYPGTGVGRTLADPSR